MYEYKIPYQRKPGKKGNKKLPGNNKNCPEGPGRIKLSYKGEKHMEEVEDLLEEIPYHCKEVFAVF